MQQDLRTSALLMGWTKAYLQSSQRNIYQAAQSKMKGAQCAAGVAVGIVAAAYLLL